METLVAVIAIVLLLVVRSCTLHRAPAAHRTVMPVVETFPRNQLIPAD